jgi:ubiquitin-protein ligase E3 C
LESEQQQEKNMPLRPLRMLSKGRLAVISPRLGLLNNIPFVIPFEQRVEIFRMFVNNDKKRNKVDEFYSRPKAAATVRRDHMFEDGFDQLSQLGVELKNKVAISFVDEFGLEEAGIDGGGVFKEFLTGLGKEAFDINYGLFTTTPEQLLYPNPSSYATEPQQLEYFKFLGLIIGKAVYEGILLDVAFAEFFLKKCLGKVNYLDDLSSLDPELYKGLLAVKNYDGNVEDLSLDFTSTHMENGKSVNVELIPGGSNIPVTNQNRIHYIYSIANYRLNVQIAKQCRAFFRGLSTIVDVKWLRMFNQQELQIVLGGASIPIDLNDLRSHTVLGGYMEHDATVKNFWKALESFDNSLRMKFVKFVTSCSRPPLLGFKELVPQFCLRNAGVDEERLPTSSTCVNLLKLPNYPTYQILREKLLYAITADAGFDLS